MSKTEKGAKRKSVKRCLLAKQTPVHGVWLSALEPFTPEPVEVARQVLKVACMSRRGCLCASCGRIVRHISNTAASEFSTMFYDTDYDTCALLACSPLCEARIQRRGPRFGLLARAAD